ncbi:hypothetical protein Zmor_024062 [Zophobas morio]|uniref:Uncharacterized protein n=1 Tax=Zophobas morio TaxID=2755281 RepID=A0AA38M760_9CUCU|nr:hypothetical protein Zmor_024062 [Zophobas morio]
MYCYEVTHCPPGYDANVFYSRYIDAMTDDSLKSSSEDSGTLEAASAVLGVAHGYLNRAHRRKRALFNRIQNLSAFAGCTDDFNTVNRNTGVVNEI